MSKKQKGLNNFLSEDALAFLDALQEEQPPLETPDTREEVGELLKRSVEEHDEVISETLANLLALQGKKSKAVKMYEALSLKFPEKSSFFAQKISELKEEL